MSIDSAIVFTIALVIVTLLFIVARSTPRRAKRRRTSMEIYTGIDGSIWLVTRIGRRILPDTKIWIQVSSLEARNLSEKLHLSAYRSDVMHGARP